MHYFETSAKENINIEAAIFDVLRQAIAQKEGEEEYVPDVVDLDAVKPATTEKCNCKVFVCMAFSLLLFVEYGDRGLIEGVGD